MSKRQQHLALNQQQYSTKQKQSLSSRQQKLIRQFYEYPEICKQHIAAYKNSSAQRSINQPQYSNFQEQVKQSDDQIDEDEDHNIEQCLRFTGKYAPMKCNPIIYKWAKNKNFCSNAIKQFENQYRNRPYFFLLLGELQMTQGQQGLKSFLKDFPSLKVKQQKVIEKKYQNDAIKIKYFKLQLDYIENSLKKFVALEGIRQAVKPVFYRGKKQIETKTRAKMADLIRLYEKYYS